MKQVQLFVIILFSTIEILFAAEQVCDGLYLTSERVEFSENEKKLICDGKTKGWSVIPINQKKFQIQTFLQSRGYYQPSFEHKNQNLYVDIGEKVNIKKISFEGVPEKFYDVQYTGPLEEELTPDNLNKIKAWTTSRLNRIGHPCADIEGRASFLTGEVKLLVSVGERIKIKTIKRENNTEFIPTIFSRYDAVIKNSVYNEDFLNLTTQRVIQSGLVTYSYFEHNCETPHVIEQKFLDKKPHSIIFGFGGSSEEIPIFETRYRNTGLDDRGSQLTSRLYFSNRKQLLEVGVNYYPITSRPRFSIVPLAQYVKNVEDIFESEQRSLSVGLIQTKETYWSQYVYEFEPGILSETNFNSDLPENLELITLNLRGSKTTHYFEYFQASPRMGHRWGVQANYFQGLNEDEKNNGTKVSVSGTYLSNYQNFAPPKTILGVRFFYHTLFTDGLEDVPQAYRLYLGGQDDIRGFGRKTINNDEKGFLTTAHLSFESRFNQILPYQLQPYLFYDFAKNGLKTMQFTDVLYHSPGIGLRFESPIGNFRLNVAYGNTTPHDPLVKEGTNLYFSYGREF
ncbi:MAG: hypothetical protein CME62_12590 [Halobacteriovoraceae bacterium]|nr:hypothetical protein [Halobacteriovoraceae bacterium]|tara:strand:+ start:12777 stop:14477 length:1701 start_codon:yes stop_codon:yes gene_type:complete